jgi:F-type H+/Na+-transporting ATPase subunit alpha
MRLEAAETSLLIKQKIEAFDHHPKFTSEGTIVTIGDGIVQITGLEAAKQGELLELEGGGHAMVMNLEPDTVGATILSNHCVERVGAIVRATGQILSVPVGTEILGRVVNPLGQPIDGLGEIVAANHLPIERPAPGVLDRYPVSTPLLTGYKAIDTMVPIGLGQRELIIGDRKTGKTTLAIDTILAQKATGVKCFYVAIGQKASTVASIVQTLKANEALKYTTVVVATASDTAALQYVAPYSACAMAEYFRDRGEHALVIYDDLSKHAVAYRQISLLLRRPPSREAFPGDIFYLHARLLERAASVNWGYLQHQIAFRSGEKSGASKLCGTLTALPILETQSGDISGFVPTNVISITDGQIYLDTSLFNAGLRPAVSPGLSVSRIGSAGQAPMLRKVSGKVRTRLSQYQELKTFSQFASDLDVASQKTLDQGERITELLKQSPHSPLTSFEEVVLFFAVEHGYLENVPVKKLAAFEKALLFYLKQNYTSLARKVSQATSDDARLGQEILSALQRFHATQIF